VAKRNCQLEIKMYGPADKSEHFRMFNPVVYLRLFKVEILTECFSFTAKVGYVSLGSKSFLGEKRIISPRNVSIKFSTINEFSCIFLISNILSLMVCFFWFLLQILL
jgi:hypothetical protein